MPHDAFLKAIRAEPADDLPRLVYADFLDESGDAERAEFIRLQIERAKTPEHEPRYRELEDREHELLSANEKKWFDAGPIQEWEWERGFPDRYVVAIEDFSEKHFQNATGVHVTLTQPGEFLYNGPLVNRVSSHFPKLGIRGLDFSPSNIDAIDLDSHSFWEYWSDLEDITFVISDANGSLDSALGVVCRLLKLRSLKFVDQSGDWICNSPIRAPERIPRALGTHSITKLLLSSDCLAQLELAPLFNTPFAENLTEIDVNENSFSDGIYTAFENAPAALKLSHLGLNCCPAQGAIQLERLLNARSLRDISHFDLYCSRAGSQHRDAILNSPFWGQAERFSFPWAGFSAEDLRHFRAARGPNALRHLDLGWSRLQNDGVRHLCECDWGNSLRHLSLNSNGLGNRSCEYLGLSGRFAGLRFLNLNGNGHPEGSWGWGEAIGDKGVRHLLGGPSLSNLRWLNLNGTNITGKGVDLALNRGSWNLFGLGVADNRLSASTSRILAGSPKLQRLNWLDLSRNPALGGDALLPLAESEFLSPLCELDCGGIDLSERVRQIFRERLGPRFSH